MLPNNRDLRSSAATSSNLFGAAGNRGNVLNGGVRSRNDSPSGAAPHPNVVIDNLIRQWQLAEQRLLALIHNAYVPASDMTPAGKCVICLHTNFNRIRFKLSYSHRNMRFICIDTKLMCSY